VFWDYYQFDDALRLIEEGRKKLGDPALYSYEAGAIQENKRDYAVRLPSMRGAAGRSPKAQEGTMADRVCCCWPVRPALAHEDRSVDSESCGPRGRLRSNRLRCGSRCFAARIGVTIWSGS